MNDLPWRITRHGDISANWLFDKKIRIMFIDNSGSSAPAVRRTHEGREVSMPGMRDGHLAFDPTDYPDLTQIRIWYPEHGGLCDAVALDFATSLPQDRNGCIEGRMGV